MRTPLTTKSSVLRALTNGPAKGLELIDRIKDMSGGGITVQRGNLYPALISLESQGLVKSKEKTSRESGRTYKEWSITPAGRKQAKVEEKAITQFFKKAA